MILMLQNIDVSYILVKEVCRCSFVPQKSHLGVFRRWYQVFPIFPINDFLPPLPFKFADQSTGTTGARA